MFPLLFFCGLLLDIPPVATECICARARTHDGWCDVCGFGIVAGLKIPSKMLFTAIDHGHEIPTHLRCSKCLEVSKSGGFCPACQIGFYKGKIFFSAFTYLLAAGSRIDRSEIKCADCQRNAEQGGWCETCHRGLFGNVAVGPAYRAEFDIAAAAFRRLKLGLAHLHLCELCGISIYANGMCPKCNLVYEDGKPKPVQ